MLAKDCICILGMAYAHKASDRSRCKRRIVRRTGLWHVWLNSIAAVDSPQDGAAALGLNGIAAVDSPLDGAVACMTEWHCGSR